MDTIEHPTLGTLEFDASLNWYTNNIVVQGEPAAFRLSLDECDDTTTLLSNGADVASGISATALSAADYAAHTLLDDINNHWLRDGELRLSHEQLVAMLLLESVVVYPDGGSEWLFVDRTAELLVGHCVIATLEPDGTFSDASING
ncbi:hypothetical protein RISK_004483 [Rhodopirellula islandica]|uniref:DUF2262 domain-containing protein n=1 Tax=Rhodopirellula islandica TaxID=595434 RepID=A0A0J1ED86_RHOIS|nr:DUF2262 domain-containing protein [Rhodopirellula islandica]KLU03479.1 hypothetical protein RISK_004483 [Rhodopirellula islandica]